MTVNITINLPCATGGYPSQSINAIYVNGTSESTSSYTSILPYNSEFYVQIISSTGVTNNSNPFSGIEYLSYSSPTVISQTQNSCGCNTQGVCQADDVIVVGSFTVVYDLYSTISGSTSFEYGNTSTYTCTPEQGTGNYTYQWYVNGSEVAGATSQSFVWNPPASAVDQTSTIYCMVSDGYVSNIQSNTLSVYVTDDLTGSISPSGNQSYPVSSTSTQNITVTANAGTGSSYSTKIYYLDNGTTPCPNPPANNSAIPSTWTEEASSSTATTSYTFSQDNTAGDYYCFYGVASDSSGYVAFSPVLNILLTDTFTATLNVSQGDISVGQEVQLVVSVSGGSGNFVYSWYQDSSLVSEGIGASFVFQPSTSGTYSFYVSVYDKTGGTISQSNTVTVTVFDALAVGITPSRSTILNTNNSLNEITITLINPTTSSITTETGFNINWSLYPQLNSSVSNVRFYDLSLNEITAWLESYNGTYPNQSTQSQVNILPTQPIPPNNGTYSFIMQILPSTTSYGTHWGTSGTSASQVLDASFSGGYTIPIEVLTAGGSGDFQYQWFDGSTGLSQCLNKSVCNYSSSSSGTHFVYAVVTDTTTENTVTTTISEVNVEGSFSVSINPSEIGVVVGSSVNIGVTIAGGSSSNFTYSWFYNTTNSNSGGTQLSVLTPSYSFTVQRVGTFYYYCVVTNIASGVSSVTGVTTVNVYTETTDLLTVSNSSIMLGNSTTLTLSVTGGSSDLTYTWYEIEPDGTEITLPSTITETYTFTPEETGSFTFFVETTDTNSGEIQYSNNVTVEVYQMLVSISESATSLVSGTSINLFAVVSGGVLPYSYDWSVSGTEIGSRSSIQISPTTTTTYTLTVTDGNSFALSDSVTITVYPFSASVTASNTILLNTVTSQTATLSLTFDPNTTPTSYQWYMNGSAISGATSSTYTFSGKGTAVGNYSFYCLVNGSVQSDSIVVQVISQLNFGEYLNINDVPVITSTNGSVPIAKPSTQFNVYVGGVQMFAYNIKMQKTINSAGSLVFTIPKNQFGLVSVGDTVLMYYRNKVVFTGNIQIITKYSTAEYNITAYDGMWYLAGIVDTTVTDTVSGLVIKYGNQTPMNTQYITQDQIPTQVTCNFEGKSVLQRLLELVAGFGYYLVCDELNNLRLVSYQNSVDIQLTENKQVLVYAKAFDVLRQYGSVQVTATIGGQSYSVFSGSGTPVHQIGQSGWLSLPSYGVLESFAQTLGSTYLQGNWDIQLIGYTYYPIYNTNTLSEIETYQVSFADGTVLNNLIETGISIQNNGVNMILMTYSDVILQLLTSLVG